LYVLFLKIARIDSSRDPPIYFLKDLLGDKVRGSFYKEQLKRAPMPGTKCSLIIVLRLCNSAES